MDTHLDLDPLPAYYHGQAEGYTDGAPVFTPTVDHFAHHGGFDGYVQAIDRKFGHVYGIVKVIPPKEWIDSLPDIRPRLAQAVVVKPIHQHFNGGKGMFRQDNVEIKRKYPVADFVRAALFEHLRPPYLPPVATPVNTAEDDADGQGDDPDEEAPVAKRTRRSAPASATAAAIASAASSPSAAARLELGPSSSADNSTGQRRTTRASARLARTSGMFPSSPTTATATSTSDSHPAPLSPVSPPTRILPPPSSPPMTAGSSVRQQHQRSHPPTPPYHSASSGSASPDHAPPLAAPTRTSAIVCPTSRPETTFFASLVTDDPTPPAPTSSSTAADDQPSDAPPPTASSKRKRPTAHRAYKFQSVNLALEHASFPYFEDDLFTLRFAPQFIREHLEPEYWRSIGILGTPAVPMYGADLQGTLWPSATSPQVWNTNALDHILARGLGAYARIPGVNSPFLYFGTWRATFGWHAEDMDLYSINYLHFGAPKAWYALSPRDADKFEAFARDKYPMDHRACSEFIRHKTFHFSPQVLRERGLEVHRMVQEKNEFVITFPRGYHAGFNLGFNCAESVNFALPRWFDIGKRARPCQCVEYSVAVDARVLEKKYAKRKALGLLDQAGVDVDVSDSDDNDEGEHEASGEWEVHGGEAAHDEQVDIVHDGRVHMSSRPVSAVAPKPKKEAVALSDFAPATTAVVGKKAKPVAAAAGGARRMMHGGGGAAQPVVTQDSAAAAASATAGKTKSAMRIKIKMDSSPAAASDEGSVASDGLSSTASRKSVKPKSSARDFANPGRPCLICPIQEPIYGLGSMLTIHPPPTSSTSCKYVHDTCARCIPELKVTRSSVTGIESILKDRWAQECCVCGLGGCVAMPCGVGGCLDAVHVGCAVKMGWVVKGEARVWCGKHAPKRSQAQQPNAAAAPAYHGTAHAMPPHAAAAYPPPYYGWPGAPIPSSYGPPPGTFTAPPTHPSHTSTGYPTMLSPASSHAAHPQAHWSQHHHHHPHAPPCYPYPPPPPSSAAYPHGPPPPRPAHPPGGASLYNPHANMAVAMYAAAAAARHTGPPPAHAHYAYPPAAPQYAGYPPRPHHAPHAGPGMGYFTAGPSGSVPLSEHGDRSSSSS